MRRKDQNKNQAKKLFLGKAFWTFGSVFLLSFFLYFCPLGTKAENTSNKNQNGNSNLSQSENKNQNPASSPSSPPAETSPTGGPAATPNEERAVDIEKSLEEKRKQLSKIEQQIETYEKILEIKRNEQVNLANEMSMIDNQIEEIKNQIKKYDLEIQIADEEIQKLEFDIAEKNKLISAKQNALKILLNDLYRREEKGLIEVLLSYDGVSNFIQEIAYNEQASQKFFGKLQEINALKKDLEAKKNEQELKKKSQEVAKKRSLEKTMYLEGEQGTKEKLLAETKGDESRYQEMLKRVEEQKQTLLGDIDDLSAANAGEMSAVQSKQRKPTSGLASTDWYYSQRDPRWGSSNIGSSDTKMSKYGCAVTCVSMVLRYHGVSIDPGIMARQPIFSDDLIVWPEQWQFVKRIGGFAHGNIDWKTVDDELADHNPVIVFVRANGRGAGHYVVIHHKDDGGKYVVHDPYWGPNIFLDSTRENISTLYKSSTSIDQMIIFHNTKRSPGENPPAPAAPVDVSPKKEQKETQKNLPNGNVNGQGMSANEFDKISQQINGSKVNGNNNNK